MNIKNKNKIKKQLEEYIKCKNDFEYFARNYIFLEMPGGDEKFKPYKKQIELIECLNKNKFIIVSKSRQIGISSVIQIYVCYLVIFFNNVVVGVISKDGSAATKFSRFIATFIDKIPKFLKPKFIKRNERSFILNNGSKVINTPVDPKNPTNCFRGESITFLVIDEAAFINKLDDAWTAMVPALATNQKHAKENNIPYGIILLSTPNKTTGIGKFFYSRYTKANTNNDIFKPFIIHWKDIKELGNDWYKTQCELFDNDERRIQQELELKFLPAKGSFFDDKTNIILQDNSTEPIDVQKIFNGEIRLYKKPELNEQYLIGIDTATENGEDKSTIIILNYKTMEQVWEFQAKTSVTDFCKVVQLACGTYPGVLIIENNSVGNQVVENLDRSVYHNMLYHGKLIGNKNKDRIPGLSVNTHSRPLIIDSLYSTVSNFPGLVKSKNLALELIGLVSKSSGKVEAEYGCHDDLAMALSFCCYVRKYDPPMMIEYSSNNKQIKDFNNIINLNDIPLNEIDNGTIIKKIKNDLNDNKIDNAGYIDILNLYEIS